MKHKFFFTLMMLASSSLYANGETGTLTCTYSNGDSWSMTTNNYDSWVRAIELCDAGGGHGSGSYLTPAPDG